MLRLSIVIFKEFSEVGSKQRPSPDECSFSFSGRILQKTFTFEDFDMMKKIINFSLKYLILIFLLE